MRKGWKIFGEINEEGESKRNGMTSLIYIKIFSKHGANRIEKEMSGWEDESLKYSLRIIK